MIKIIFAGTPEFALSALRLLIDSPYEICAIYTQPDRPAGRGQKLVASPIKTAALAYNLPVYQPLTLKDPVVQGQFRELAADLFVDVAYGLLIPAAILEMPKFGCINIHPSLLPRWRGAAPLPRAIMAGDNVTGVTIMQMDRGLDTGDIYKQTTIPIENNDTTAILRDRCADIGARLLLEVIDEIVTGTAKTTAQDHQKSTYADKVSKEEGIIDWRKSAVAIERVIRAFIPWPVAHTKIDDQYIRVWQAEIKDEQGREQVDNLNSPGTIVRVDNNSIDVATGDGVLSLLKLQFSGKKPLQVSEIIKGRQKLFVVGKKLA